MSANETAPWYGRLTARAGRLETGEPCILILRDDKPWDFVSISVALSPDDTVALTDPRSGRRFRPQPWALSLDDAAALTAGLIAALTSHDWAVSPEIADACLPCQVCGRWKICPVCDPQEDENADP